MITKANERGNPALSLSLCASVFANSSKTRQSSESKLEVVLTYFEKLIIDGARLLAVAVTDLTGATYVRGDDYIRT
jgi:hypothetical protein